MSEIREKSNKKAKSSNSSGGLKCMLCFLHFLYRIIVVIARYFFAFYYRNDKKKIPSVTEPLLQESAISLAHKIRTKEIKSEDLIKLFIERIKEVNPLVNCFVEDRFEAALTEARKADELIRSGQMTEEQLLKEKPLLGVPFTTKDCIAVKDLHQTSGLVSRRNVVAEEDALCIGYLRKAGAIPIGLTNISELCMWWESSNNLHGRSNNAYDTRRGVGGSSGGEGCMQSVCGSAFGVGSDIGGSIRMPCFFNGVFGHKPSKFIVSNHGQFPQPANEYQSSFLGLGPMARKASDLKPLLKIMAGENASKLKLDEKVDVKKLKVYYQNDNLNSALVCNVEPEIRKALSDAVSHLQKTCETSPEQVKIKKMVRSTNIWTANMRIKDSPSFAERITGIDSYVNILFELGKNLIGKSNNTFIGLITALFEKAGVEPGSPKHDAMIKLRQELEDEFKEILKNDGVFLYPTHPTAVPYHNEPLVRAFNFTYTAIINTLGLPAAHIPMGLNEEGLPIGIQVVSNFNNDRYCLAVAEELEKVFGGWVDPGRSKKEE